MNDSHFALFDKLPAGFLDCPADRLIEILPGPSLIDLPGRDPRPLFLSVLLHGNEDSGLIAVQEVLRRCGKRELHRALLLFVGNVGAAAAHVRTLPEQMDFNRIWPGTLEPHAPLSLMAGAVFDYAARKKPFASVDIHNNTGFNPHYSCVTRLEPEFISLAQLFSRTVVHFQRPLGVQAGAMARLCPAITVECGKAGAGVGADHAASLIEAVLAMSRFPEHGPSAQDVDLLRTCAIVKLPAQASFSFDGSAADFRFRSDLDHLNFRPLRRGDILGECGESFRLETLPGDGDHPAEEYFDYADGRIRLTRPAIPAMLTLDPRAIRLDCLCYFMHRIG
ncbi:M14 family metallopeptidase [Methylocystis heyeri]|uniref:Peptidase M14 n=1 Tax=Methylocystis heyeri TaxID=391905 RepID=A0A6B8K9Y4_9HYPH|nr:M14 family metallopeptidase [Methylocystis heyeri]QGM44232.1 peptidase M14 [Methylocystis heyeri]